MTVRDRASICQDVAETSWRIVCAAVVPAARPVLLRAGSPGMGGVNLLAALFFPNLAQSCPALAYTGS